MTRRRTYRIDEMQGPLSELLIAGDRAQDTRSPLHPLAEWLAGCTTCGAAKGEPCVPLDGPDRETRAERNHASHVARRRAAAEHLSQLLASELRKQAQEMRGAPGAGLSAPDARSGPGRV